MDKDGVYFMKTTELERTFLLKYLPKGLDKCRKEPMTDIYIPGTAVHPIVRIRHVGDRFEITKKAPVAEGDSSVQHEHTISLTEEEHDALAKLPGKRLDKTRYFLKIDGRDAEVDVFHGELEGLALADFEFGSEEEKSTFVAPDFCLADVTQEEFIAGGMLCGKRYQEIEKELKRFRYKKLLKK
jgi:CYTH domain-containing protein